MLETSSHDVTNHLHEVKKDGLKLMFINVIHGVINEIVDKDYNLKTIKVKQNAYSYLNTRLFCNLYVKLYVILTSNSAINEV